MRVKGVQGGMRVDVGRVMSYKQLASARVREVRQMGAQAGQKVAGARDLGLAVRAAPGYAGPPAGAPPVSGTNGIVVTGALWWKKHLCARCGQQLDRSWDRCPFCSQSQGLASVRTQAMRVDAAGAGSGMQLCGWLVAVKGAQRGELYTLDPVTSVGTDPACTIVLSDRYMSARHCEIRAEGGAWMLRDLKSTNGTYVNDKRIEQRELLDSDYLRLGECVLKFKSL
jgi:FHA domain